MLATLGAADPCAPTVPGVGAFHLSGFSTALKPAGGFFHAQDSTQHDYYFAACGPLSKLACSGSSATPPVAIQTWGSPAPQPPKFPEESCAGLGAATTATCRAQNASVLTCDYSDGDGGRTVSFEYSCAASYSPPTASQTDPLGLQYYIRFAGPAACARPRAVCGFATSTQKVFADMHDGDEKLMMTDSTGSQLTILPYPGKTQSWKVTATIDPTNCTAMVDFNVPGKPNPPPVALLASLSQFAGPTQFEDRSVVVFTDPSGTIAPADKALNAWVEEAGKSW